MIVLLLALCAAAAPASAVQDRREIPGPEFGIRLRTEPVRNPALWVSRDGGASWSRAAEAGVTESWDEWADGAITCMVRVPADGDYDLYAQLGDLVSNTAAAPEAGTPGRPDMRFHVASGADGASDLSLTSPRAGEELIGGNQVDLRWQTDRKDVQESSLHLYVQVGGRPWEVLARRLDARGAHRWTLPTPGADARIRFRAEAFSVSGDRLVSPVVECPLRVGGTVAALAWEEPSGGERWNGGDQVTLRWRAAGPSFLGRSARVEYQVGDDRWIPVTKGLEAADRYVWVVPNRDADRLRLRVTAVTRGGAEASAVSETVSVRATERANVAQARALYDRARVLHAQGRDTEARLKYEEAIAAWNEFGEVYNDLGKLHGERREYARALEYFLRARKICPSDPVPYVNAAWAEARLGLHDDAMATLRNALDLGLERHGRSSVLAGETLWSIARESVQPEVRDWRRAREACQLIGRIRPASRATRERAKRLLEEMEQKALYLRGQNPRPEDK